MNKNISLAFLIIGIVLISWAVVSSNSLSSDISNFLTNSSNDKPMWLLISGLIISIVGFFGVFPLRD